MAGPRGFEPRTPGFSRLATRRLEGLCFRRPRREALSRLSYGPKLEFARPKLKALRKGVLNGENHCQHLLSTDSPNAEKPAMHLGEQQCRARLRRLIFGPIREKTVDRPFSGVFRYAILSIEFPCGVTGGV